MRSVVIAAAAIAVVGAGAAFAKAPKPADLPTVEDVYQQAKSAIKAQQAGGAAKQDPLKEAIEGYRSGALQLTDFKTLVDCLNDAKAAPEHRMDVASALIERFGKVDLNNPEVRATRRTIARALIDLMKADKSKDDTGLKAIEQILYAASWYRPQMFEFKFHASDKPAARLAAWTKMKKFLDKGEN